MYRDNAWTYRRAGWAGVLPLPAGEKWPPPSGWTGWAGADPSGADVQAWADGAEGAGNIALRLPVGVYGLDVDDYGGKSGGAALARLVAEHGPLPATWVVGSRVESVSGIRLFRAELPAGRRWADEPGGHGAGIEAIHFGHRYAVVAPSLHPEGRKYVWRRPDGMVAGEGEVPRAEELPTLPDAWVAALSQDGEARTGDQAGHVETVDAVRGMREGEPCERVRAAGARGCERLREARDGAALHPAGRDTTHELVALGWEGHAGVRAALAAHHDLFVGVREVRAGARTDGEAEWWRLVRGAVGKMLGQPAAACDCALWAGEGLGFEFEREVIPGQTLNGGLSQTPDDDPSEGVGGVGGEPSVADRLFGRLLSAAQVRDLRPPTALVEGLLTLDSEAWLIAKPGSYKTFVALDMAGHVATGRAWMGREVAAGPVLYVAAEGAGGLGSRVRAWEQRNGEMTGVQFLPVPVQAAREEQWAALVEVAARVRPVLIVLDTQARVTVGLNENDNSEMGMFVHALGLLRRATSACVLTVHHLGRNGQDARGASAIDGAQDTELRLTRTADLRVVLQTDKQRHLSDDARVELELFATEVDGGGSSLVVGPPLTAGAAQPDYLANLPTNQATLVGVMADVFPVVGASKAELKAEVLKRVRRGAEGEVMPPMGDSSFRKAWDTLVGSERFVRINGTQRHMLANDAIPSVDVNLEMSK